jgi:hypothetical protein
MHLVVEVIQYIQHLHSKMQFLQEFQGKEKLTAKYGAEIAHIATQA